MNWRLSQRDKFSICSSDVIYFGTELTFDPSLVEVLLALTTGSCLLIVSFVTKLNPTILFKTLFPQKTSKHKGITVLQTVPSLFRRWSISQQKSILSSNTMKILAFGGEAFPLEILDYDISEQLKLFNLYGITEVSCWSSINEVNRSSSDISLGVPLSDTILEVRNEFGHKILDSEGEIFIGSYTRKCIIHNEIKTVENEPLYRATGDLGKITENGLYYLGRKNNIVKRFGHRINMDKIETKIFKETALVNKCIWYKHLNKLIIFILLEGNHEEQKRKIVDKLRVKLLHMLSKEEYPDSIDLVPTFPLTSHGKIDTSSLLSTFLKNRKNDYKNVNEYFMSLCVKYLGLNETELQQNRHCSFFEAGGNSISAIQILEEMKRVITNEKFVSTFFEKSLNHCLDVLKDFDMITPSSQEQVSLENTLSENDLSDIKKIKYEKSMAIKWKYDLGACVDCSPVVFQNKKKHYVAVGSFSNIFIVSDAVSGEVMSRFVLPKSIESSCLPSVHDTCIYVGSMDGNMYCIDYIKNETRWKFSTGDQIKSQPSYCKVDKSAIVFGSYDKHVYSLSSLRGDLIWKTHVVHSVACTPLFEERNENLYIITTLGTCLCLDANNGSILWKFQRNSPTFTSPKLLSSNSLSLVYGEAKGTIICLEGNGNLKWSFQANGHIFSSPVVYNDFIAFGCNDGNLYILKESGNIGKLYSKIALYSSIVTTPYVCELYDKTVAAVACQDGLIYLLEISDTVCIELVKFKLAYEIFSSPFMFENRIYIGCRDNFLYCIEIE